MAKEEPKELTVKDLGGLLVIGTVLIGGTALLIRILAGIKD